MRATLVLLALSAAFVFTLFVAEEAEATHYRFGVLSWEPTGNGNEVKFTGGQAWRRSAFNNPNVGAIIQGEAGIATGTTTIPIYLKVTTVSVVNDYFVAQFVDAQGNDGIKFTYPAPNNNGQPWIASFSSCCRISPHSSGNFHVNNPDQSERLETRIDLSEPNASPKSLLPPINPCPIDAVCTLPIPHFDPDGEDVTFRFATTAEAGDSSYVRPGPPHAPNGITIDADTGTLTWDTNGATISSNPTEHTLYSIQVILEDARTKVPLDFFIELLPEGYSPPYWVEPPSPCGQTLFAGAGNPVAFTVKAQSDDVNRTIRINHLGIPTGASFPLPTPSNPTSGGFAWTPSASQVGSHLVLFTAEDDRGFAAPTCAVTIVVIKGDAAARGLALEVVGADGTRERYESGDMRDGPTHRALATGVPGVASVAGVEMHFEGGVQYHLAPALIGRAYARTTAGVVDVPGVLHAEGITVTAESLIDPRGAESFSEVRFTRLRIGGAEIDVSTLDGSATFELPGVATVHVHVTNATGDAVNDANMTAWALRVVLHSDLSPVKELLIVSASADVGRNVEDVTVAATPLPALPAAPPPPVAAPAVPSRRLDA